MQKCTSAVVSATALLARLANGDVVFLRRASCRDYSPILFGPSWADRTMRATTFCWSVAVGLALIVVGPRGRLGDASQAHAANPLRASHTSAPVSTSGADVRLVVESNGTFHSDRPQSAVRTAQYDQPVSTASDSTTMRSWTLDAPQQRSQDDPWRDSSSEVTRIGTIIHPDGEVEPAAYYRPAPRHNETPPNPVAVSAKDAGRIWAEGNRRSESAPADDVQASAPKRSSTDRFHGPGGLRTTSRDMRNHATAAAPRRPTRTPNTTVPQAATMKLAMAGVSPSARPASAAPGTKIAGSKAAAFASRPTSGGQQTAPQVVQLLGRAHKLAGMAETEAQYTQVIVTCRRVMAHEQEGVAADYAKQLASWALNRRGQLHVKAGHKQDAMHDFQAAIRLDPKLWRAVHNRGVLLATSGQFEGAFDDFDRTITLNPRYAKAYANRAALLVVAGKMELAIRDYRKAIQLDPELVTAHRGLAKVCHLTGNLSEALAHYDDAIQLAPDDAYTLTRRADLLTDLGRYAAAADEYERAIELDPRLTPANRGSAWLLATCPDQSIRNPSLAVRRAEAALRLEDQPAAESFDALAAAQASRGDFRAAVATARRAIQLAPESQRGVFQQRLAMYQQSQSFQLRPRRSVQQATYSR